MTRSFVQVGDVLTLKGKTLRGKNKIREHGARWTVQRIGSPFDETALFITSLQDGDKRWMASSNLEFEIVVVNGVE